MTRCEKKINILKFFLTITAILMMFSVGAYAEESPKPTDISEIMASPEIPASPDTGIPANSEIPPHPDSYGTGGDFALPEQSLESSYYVYSSINQVGFVRRKPVIPSGSIFKIKDDKRLVSGDDIIYIREGRNNPLILGRYYLTYKMLGVLKDRQTKTDLGTQYFLTGIVEIIEKKPHFVVGRIIRAFHTITMDNLLMPYIERSPKIPLNDSAENIKGHIIGSENRTELIGEYSVIFLDKGERNGLKPGQLYHIFSEDRAKITPDSDREISLPPTDIGELIVLRTEKNTATAVITRSRRTIRPGTMFGSPVAE